jgi:hypothetical protein
LDESGRVVPTADEVPGFQVRLKNGSRFFAYIRDVDLAFTSPVMGDREIAAFELRGLVSATIANSTEDDESLNPRPRLLLRGGQVLVGRFVEDAVDIQTEGQPLLIPRDEIRAMKRREQDDQVLPNAAPQYVVLLWSGDVIAGHLRDDIFAVQVDDMVCNVPLRDLMEVHIPVPKLTVDGRAKILEMIGKLGEEDWRTRKLANTKAGEPTVGRSWLPGRSSFA